MFCDRQGGDSDGMVVELTSVYVYIHVHVYTLPVLITTDIEILIPIIRVRVIVFNTIINNISVISWQSVLLVEETKVHGENHQPVSRH